MNQMWTLIMVIALTLGHCAVHARPLGIETATVLNQLSEQHTLAIVEFGPPHKFMSKFRPLFRAAMQAIPSDQFNEIRLFFDPTAHRDHLKFEPLKATGWRQIGIEPNAGLFMILLVEVAITLKRLNILVRLFFGVS